MGIPVGPTMVTIFSVGSVIAPPQWMGTVMTALASGIVAGTALGSSIAGSLAQTVGYHTAFLVPIAAAGALLLLGLVAACCCAAAHGAARSGPSRAAGLAGLGQEGDRGVLEVPRGHGVVVGASGDDKLLCAGR